MNVHEALLHGEELLADITDPRWNAERILLLALNTTRADLYTNLQRRLSEIEVQDYQELLQKRAEHYPLAYIEGTQEFCGHEFRVDPSVLIPRPETEEIIRAVLNLRLPSSPKIIDLGAGSGCIAVTLANQIKDATVVALEFSADALGVLRENANRDTHIVRGNLYTTPFSDQAFDVVVSNPPYVEQGTELAPETKWEPLLALMTDSLEKIYDTLLQQALRLLRPLGYVVFEIGFAQEQRIKKVADAHREFALVEIRKDYRGLPRVFVLRKKM